MVLSSFMIFNLINFEYSIEYSVTRRAEFPFFFQSNLPKSDCFSLVFEYSYTFHLSIWIMTSIKSRKRINELTICYYHRCKFHFRSKIPHFSTNTPITAPSVGDFFPLISPRYIKCPQDTSHNTPCYLCCPVIHLIISRPLDWRFCATVFQAE